MNREPALAIKNLSVWLAADGGALRAVRDLSLTVGQGGCTGIVGESGCGKSLTCRAVLGLLEPAKWRAEGRVLLRGEPVPIGDDRAMDAFRGRRIGLIPQDPLSALDPRMTVGAHFCEGKPRRARNACLGAAAELLARMQIRAPAEVLRAYPFQLSGGMLQRVIIALAVDAGPEVLLADEPTTALDSTTQQEILQILRTLQREKGCALLLVTHDLEAAARMADTLAVMYGGQIVEYGPREAVWAGPLHPYTRGLLRARPAFSKERLEAMEGRPPRLGELEAACPFAPRCPQRSGACAAGELPLREGAHGHWSRCMAEEVGGLGTLAGGARPVPDLPPGRKDGRGPA